MVEALDEPRDNSGYRGSDHSIDRRGGVTGVSHAR
jgi:hypothetical protein